jgi:hypothetical protein
MDWNQGSKPEASQTKLGEVAQIVGWLGVAALMLGGLLALSGVAAAAVLYLLGWLLNLLLVDLPRWIAGL